MTPSFERGLAVAALYAAVFLVAGLLSGVDYDKITESASNVIGFVIIPVGLASAASLALTARWGWWTPVFRESERLTRPRWARLVPALFALAIVTSLIVAPWHQWSGRLVLLILAGTMMVGFGEELVFRGYLLVGARARFSERGAWFWTSALFGLFHGINILTGQSVGATIRQVVVAFVLGGGLYLIRRLSGRLVVAMLIHGLWDFSTFIAAGRGHAATEAVSGKLAVVPCTIAAGAFTIAALIAVFRHDPKGRLISPMGSGARAGHADSPIAPDAIR
ncbi:MAG: CPBP family intramembrane glutamic endopeptidase [Solirubrobacteraceae bacterium]